MSRKPLNPVQYVAELNRRLWADPEFSDGMSFKRYPDGSIACHQRDAAGAGNCTIPAVFARIEAQVACEYALVAPVPAARLPETVDSVYH